VLVMAYITQTELGQLSALPTAILDELDATEPGTIDAALDAATGTVNGYLASRYDLPLSSVGEDVKQACADVAAYRLASRHGYANEGANADLRQRYDDAIAWLRDVAKGLVTPDVTTTAPEPTALARIVGQTARGW
jgi:phage gp36-like protein